MTSAPTAPPPSYRPQAATSGGAIPFHRLVAVELRKSVNTVAGFWLVVGVGLLALVIDGFLMIIAITQNSESNPALYSYVAAFGLSLALPVLAIMLVTSEWTQRTAMVTFALEPRRLLVMGAKYVASVILAVGAFVVAIVVGLGVTLICQLARPDATTWDLGGGLLAGLLVITVLATSLGFALGCLLLNTPAAIVLFAVYRAVPITIFAFVGAYIEGFRDVLPYISFEYSQGPLYAGEFDVADDLGPLVVSGLIWLGLPLVLGLVRIVRAEVK